MCVYAIGRLRQLQCARKNLDVKSECRRSDRGGTRPERGRAPSSKAGALRKLRLTTHKEKLFDCSKCDMKFKRLTELKEHEKIHIALNCSDCEEEFIVKQSIMCKKIYTLWMPLFIPPISWFSIIRLFLEDSEKTSFLHQFHQKVSHSIQHKMI